ncbi:MAG: hypothetical protein IPJ00_22675 [Saprospirales bacterium]|nr:hypothetical protein [Saprospirales bacterium]
MKEQNLHHGQRLEELLSIGWRYKASAAKEFGVKPNTIQKWKNAARLNRVWFERYGNVLMASGLNPGIYQGLRRAKNHLRSG